MSAFVLLTDICHPLDWEKIFPVERPIHLDLGAGDGGFAVEWARTRPGINVLAVERLLGRARKIAKKAERAGLDNLRVLRFEISYLMRYLIIPQSIESIHIMHPDPWPKRKQQKHRLFQSDFVQACARVLQPGGSLLLTMDHPGYFREILKVVSTESTLKPFAWKGNEQYPLSDFQKTFISEGKVILRQGWCKLTPKQPSIRLH